MSTVKSTPAAPTPPAPTIAAETVNAALSELRRRVWGSPPTGWRIYAESVLENIAPWVRASGRSGVDEAESQRVAALVVNVSRTLLTLPAADMEAISKPVSGWSSDAIAAVVSEAKNAVISKHPALVAYAEELTRRNVLADAAQQRRNGELLAQLAAAAPATLLARLRRTGVKLALEHGKITVPAGTAMSLSDRDEIVAHADALKRLLAAEIEAAKPTEIV